MLTVRVLFANKFFFLNGGSERVLFQERAFLLNRGVHVVDFSMVDHRNFGSPHSHLFVSHVDYRNAGGIWHKLKSGARFIHSKEAVDKIERLILEERPDIAHLHNIYHQITPSIIPVLKRHKVKVVLTLHDGKLVCPSYLMLNKGETCTACGGRHFWKPVAKGCQGSITRELLLMFEAYWHKWKGSYDGVDVFIAPSQFIGDLISQRVPRKKIRVLHNGINVDEFVSRNNDEGYGLYFGRLSKEKGVETLLEAHKTLGNGLALKLVGTGPMEDELRSMYPEAEFLGYKEGDQFRDIISQCAFVVVPSEWYENCPMVVLEAMAMGKPVVGSRIGGIPEQIEDGKTGLLFDMGNASELGKKMKLLSENPSMRLELGRAARKKLEAEYSLKDHCQGLLELYEGFVG